MYSCVNTRIHNNGGLKVGHYACTLYMYKHSYRHTCINASVSVHTQFVIRTIVTDLVYEKKSDLSVSYKYLAEIIN